MDATGAENHTTILVIEPSTLDKEVLYVGTDDGRVHVSKNAGTSWEEISKLPGLPKGSWITQIKASNKNKAEALLVANNYRRFDYTPYAYRTTNYGRSWTRIIDQEDTQSYALCIIEDPQEKNLLFLGTDDGLYYSTNAAKTWTKWTHGFPTVPVKDLVIQERENDLVIGTFGRAAWVLDDISPLRAIAKETRILEQRLKVFTPPTAYLAAYQQPTGSRFGADAMYQGENKAFGAHISYWYNAKQTTTETLDSSEEQKPPSDSIFMKIYDKDRLIRTLKRKVPDSSGIYRWTWYLNEAGGDRPSRKIRKRKNEPSGSSVKPGNYDVVLSNDGVTTQTTITVASDPRLAVSQKAIDQRHATSKKVQQMTQIAADAVKQLVESKNTATNFSKTLKKEDKKLHKDAIDLSAKISETIENLISLYIGKEDKRQGITRNPEVTVLNRIRTAGWYGGSRPDGITQTEITLLKHAQDQLNNALDKTNAFFEKDWLAYKDTMTNVKTKPFKDTKVFNKN